MSYRSGSLSKGKGIATERGKSSGMPQVHYAQHPLKCFSLKVQRDKILESREGLIEDVLAMLMEAVEQEMAKLPKKYRKPSMVNGKQYTPIEGSFLVELVEPGMETVTLLLGMDNLYVQGFHVLDIWFLMKDCTAPLPPSSQKNYGPKIVNAGTESEFKFKCGIYHFSWSASYLDLRFGMEQSFFYGAAEKAQSLLTGAPGLVADETDEDLQPGIAFFAIFLPECIRFPHVKGWTRCHMAPGACKGVTPPLELQILMNSWGDKSDLSYSEQASLLVRRCLRIIKRNPKYHSQLKLESVYERGSASGLHCQNALEPRVNQEGPINEDDILDEEEFLDDSYYAFYGHADGIVSVACSPVDASLVLSGGSDDRAFLWEILSEEAHLMAVHELDGHEATVCTVAFSSDGKLVACGSMEGKVNVWDTDTAALKGTLYGSGCSFVWLKWHPRGHLIIAGSEDSDVWLWNADHLSLMLKFAGHGSTVTCGDFTPDGKLICTGSSDASLIIWNPKTAKIRNLIRGADYHAEGLTCLAITLDSQSIVSCSKDGSVIIVNINTGQVTGSLGNNTSPLHCVGISPSSLVATGSQDSNLSIWDTAPREEAQYICKHKGSVTCLVWVGRFVASGCDDGKVRLWDSTSGELSCVLSGHHGKVFSIAVTTDHKNIVSVGVDNSALVFSISSLM